MTDIHRGFQDAGGTAGAGKLFAFLDAANALDSIRSYRQEMLDLCPPGPGDRILDIGCGLGHGTRELAPLVGATGAVTGIDRNGALIAEAARRARASGAPVTYRVGDACRLDFPDGHFDLCRIERVLMYVAAPERALDEMVRVLRPGGRFALFEFDYDCIVVDAADEVLTRRILRRISTSVPGPWIGRRLPRLLRDRGGRDLTVVPHLIATPLDMFRRVAGGAVDDAAGGGGFDAARIARWWRDLEARERDGRFFAGFFGFLVTGLLPGSGAGAQNGG